MHRTESVSVPGTRGFIGGVKLVTDSTPVPASPTFPPEPAFSEARPAPPDEARLANLPCVYHITTWKAGSTWVQGVLSEIAPDRVLVPEPEVADGIVFCDVSPGRIYTPLYINRPRFDDSPFAVMPHRKFVVLRDLRDTLVSWYFSLAKTHGENPEVLMHRRELQAMNKEEGLLYLLDHPHFYGLSMIGSTWLRSTDTLVLRFESLIEEPLRWFRLILDECEIDTSPDDLAAALQRRSFEVLANRPRGTEGLSHYRRGVAGDWKGHFTDRIAREFALRFDDLLVRSGYEPTLGPSGLFQPP